MTGAGRDGKVKLERVGSAEQIAEVAALAKEIWRLHYVPIVGAEQVEYMLDRFQSAEAIARQSAEAGYEYHLARGAGYLGLAADVAKKKMLLSKIYVRESLRVTGLGRAMTELAERRAAERGCGELWLTVNVNNSGSIAFYERMGFGKTGRLVQDIGGGYVMDDWRMAKAVAARKYGGAG